MTTGPCPHCGKELGGDQAPAKAGPAAVDTFSVHGELSMDESGGSLDLAVDPKQERMTGKQRAFSVKSGSAAMPEAKPKPQAPRTDAGQDPGDNLDLAVDIRRERMTGKQRAATSKQAPASKGGRLQLEVDEELARISGYGLPPEGWMGAVQYYLRVTRRRKEIAILVRQIEEEVASKTKDLDDDLLIIGRRKIGETGTAEAYPMASAAVDIAREKVEETKQEKSIEAKEMEDKEAFLDDELLKLESEVGKLRIEEEALGKDAQLRSGEYKKARLKMQRFDIETRNLRQLIMNQARGGDDAAASPGRIESLEAQVRDIDSQKKLFEPELASLQAAAEEVDRKLALVRTTMAEIMGKMTLSRKRKSIVVSSLLKQVETIEGKFRGMQDQQNDAIRRLALECVERDDLPAEFKGMKEKLAGRRKALAAATDKLTKTKAARESYSRTAFQRAYITVGGGVALLLLLIILLGLIL
jgi:hypothetical protein